MSKTLVATLVVSGLEENEPQVTSSVMLDGRPVEAGLAVVVTGEAGGVYWRGLDTTRDLREAVTAASTLRDRLQDALLGALINAVGRVAAAAAPAPEAPSASPPEPEPASA